MIDTVCEKIEFVENRRTQPPETGGIPYPGFGRCKTLSEVANRLRDRRNFAFLVYADHAHVEGVDTVGTWCYRPDGGLHPCDLDALAPLLENAWEIDILGRGMLESRLIYDDMNPFHARWAVEEGVPRIYRHWVSEPDDEPLTPDLMKDGWDKVVLELGKLVKNTESLLPPAWGNPGAIAWFLGLERPYPDGPGHISMSGGKTRDFWWHRLPYPVENRSYDLASSLWYADNHSLRIFDVLAEIWKIPLDRQRVPEAPVSKREPSDVPTVRAAATRFNNVFIDPGPFIHVKLHQLYDWQQVTLTLP
jgi:hypothetical protein